MTIFYFVLAFIALGFLVFIHELGHYIVAKKSGMTVEVFSIGFGRPLMKWRWQNVDWQLGWLPFGGYVKIAGMDFGKKDKNLYTEPYDIPNGFFSKSPWKRIAVAVAGPLANFILAFLIFVAIWAMGGRQKPFSEFTHVIGYVDPKSELYAQGIRPGDILTEYNHKPYKGPKDLLYATVLEGKKVELKGYKIDYSTGQKTPFATSIESYPSAVTPNGIHTTGITSGARYLIYDELPGSQKTQLFSSSPVMESGIQYQDRLVWANGELLFSMEQLSQLLSREQAYLTVERNGQVIHTRQPRVKAGELKLAPHVREELMDWQYETELEGRWQDLYVLPYVINTEGFVEAPLAFIDDEAKMAAFPYSEMKDFYRPLQARDIILSVNGEPVHHGYQILESLQKPQVLIIVQKNVPASTKVTWTNEDEAFLAGFNTSQIDRIVETIGEDNPITTSDGYELLLPIEPKPLSEMALSQESQALLQKEYAKQRKAIAKLKDEERRTLAYDYLEKSQNRPVLGLTLQDRLVDYNPSPFKLLGDVFAETGRTLKALFTGHLHPKWLSGPVGIVHVIQHGWTLGIGEALFWIAAISVNLGVLNLLPIPVLDGGYICLSLWELISKRKMKAKTMERLIIPFMVLVIALFIFLTFQDISRFF